MTAGLSLSGGGSRSGCGFLIRSLYFIEKNCASPNGRGIKTEYFDRVRYIFRRYVSIYSPSRKRRRDNGNWYSLSFLNCGRTYLSKRYRFYRKTLGRPSGSRSYENQYRPSSKRRNFTSRIVRTWDQSRTSYSGRLCVTLYRDRSRCGRCRSNVCYCFLSKSSYKSCGRFESYMSPKNQRGYRDLCRNGFNMSRSRPYGSFMWASIS